MWRAPAAIESIVRNPVRPRRLHARPDHQGGGRADLPDGGLRLRHAQHGADLFDLKVAGNIYTRIMNPTTDVLEKRVAALEGGIGGAGAGLGHGGDHLRDPDHRRGGRQHRESASALYGGTYNLFAHTFPQYGIRRALCRPPRPGQLREADRRAHQGVLRANPSATRWATSPISQAGRVAHRHGVPLIVDNTVPTPYLCRPIEHGADIVVHSLTKYLGGHGNSHRRHHRRLGQVPLGAAQGALPSPERAGRVLPRRGLHRGAGGGGLHRPRARGAAAQHGRGCRRSTPS
jgi:hypothetical protein